MSIPDQKPGGGSAAAEPDIAALRWMRRSGAQNELLAAIEERMQRRNRRWAVLAATGTALAILTVSLYRPHAASRAPHAQAVAAPVAASSSVTVTQPRREILADGSVVELAKGTQIAVDFSGPLRRVTLRSGEAHFQVAKNKRRPFVVSAGGVEVRAVGTAFAVGLGSKEIEILVTEGRIALDRREASPSPESVGPTPIQTSLRTSATVALLGVGQRAVLATAADSLAQPKVSSLTQAEMADRLAWRVPELEFSHTPLAEVIALVNLHNPVQFLIGDPALRSIKLSGNLRANNAEGLVRLLEASFNVKVERRGNTQILLHKSA